MTAPAQLFVYYKVDANQHDTLAPKARLCLDALRAQWPGLQAQLLQRPEADPGQETWMETYRFEGGVTTAMEAAIAQAANAAGLPRPRHVERFIALR